MNDKEQYYAIYSRKSKFTGKGESIENQIEKCKEKLLYKYGEDIKDKIKIYQDEGFTGYNTNRPEFRNLFKDIKDKKIKLVIVYRLDRISRNVSDFCNLKDELEKYNVDFISVTENFDTSTPMGVAMLMISSVFAQLERDTIAERIRDNMYELAKTGRWLGGTTPIGYKSEKVENISLDGKKRSLYKLEKIDEEADKVKLLFDKMLELKGLSKLESYLINNEIKTRNNINFSRFALVNIFKNPVYVIADKNIKEFFENLGAIIYASDSDFDGKRALIAYNKRYEEIGKTHYIKDISEWIIAIGKHEGIVSSHEFISVWNLIENNKDKRMRMPSENKSILSGIIRCKHCGSFMRPRMRNSINENGERNFSYLCVLKDKSRKQLCQCKNINGIETDKLVVEKIKELTVPTNEFMIKLKELVDGLSLGSKSKENELKNLNMTLSRNKIKIDNLIDRISLVDSDIVSEIAKEIKKLKLKNKEIEDNLEKLKSEVVSEEETKKTAEIALDMINTYMDKFDDLDIITKRTLIKLLVSSIESDGENLYINFIGSSNTSMSPRGNSSICNFYFG